MNLRPFPSGGVFLRRRLAGGCLLWCAAFFTAGALNAQDATPAPPALEVRPLPPIIARYEQMLAASPTKGTAFDKVYQHFFEGEGIDALDARWRARATGNGPDAPAFLLLEGLLAERRAKPAQARALYQQYTSAHPADPRGWTALGELETSEGRFTASSAALAHALSPDAAPPVPRSARPTLFRELARSQTRDFQVPAALETWRKLAAEFPDDPSVLEEVGEAYQEAESYDEARTTFEKVRDLARQSGDAFGSINATLRLGQIEEARGHAQTAVAIYEGVVAGSKTGSWLEREARARIEQLYRSQEDLPGLADYYQKWLADHPKDVEVATRRAAVLVELNHKDQAIDLLRQAVEWAPDHQELQVELARRLGEVNRPAEMIAVMEKLTAVAPEEKSYWVLLGDARWQMLDIGPAAATMPPAEKARLKAGALEAWSHLSPAESKDAVATSQFADLLASHRLADEALTQYARAAALAPDVPDIRERWAAYLAQINRVGDARQVLAGIVAADPKNATAANYGRLATGLDRLDDPAGALAATAQGLALEPHNFDLLAERWQELANLKRWDEALALYPALLGAAPNAYFAEQVETRQVSALQSAGKLAETRHALAARLGAPPPAVPLDENEMALLVRADLQASGESENDANDEAKRALAEGRVRFPRSTTLVRLEAEHARHTHDPDAQVAALRRLIELDPAQKTDLLAEIAHAWRDAGRLDEALAAAREMVAASPANATSYLLEADLLLQGGNPDEGLAQLREAVKLSDKPNEIRLRLARAETDLGHAAQARQTLDDAFEAAADAHERLSLMKPLADAYQRENRLDELIGRFQHLQQSEEDGWRYALYLADIYQETLDYGTARRELAKALAARPKDGALLRQLVRLATEEQNSAEVARYQALLTEAEPSDANKLALVQALLDNNQPVEGFNALRADLAAVLKIPGAWDQLLPLLAKNNLTQKAGDLLAAELGGPNADLKARFTLALFQAVAGNLEQATTEFWSVFAEKNPPVAAAPAPAPTPTTGSAGGTQILMSIYTGMSIPEQRFRAGEQARFLVQQFVTSGAPGMSRIRNYYSSTASPAAGAPSATDTARDSALLYLAAIAVKQNSAPAFLAELDRQLTARDSSREDRLIAYALVNAVDGELREITAQVQTPLPGLDAFCLSRLLTLAQQNAPTYRLYSNLAPLTEPQAATMLPLFEALLARSYSTSAPHAADQLDLMRYQFLTGLHRPEAAEALRRKLLAGIGEKSTRDQLQMALSLLLNGDFSAADRAQLETICHALAQDELKSKPASAPPGVSNSVYYYPILVFQPTAHVENLSPAELAEVEGALFTLWYPAAPPPAAGAGLGNANANAYGYRSFGGSARSTEFMPPTRFLDVSHVQILLQVAQSLRGQPDRLQALLAELDRQAKELPPAQRLYPRLISAYLASDTGNNDKALADAQAMLAEMPEDNDLRLLTGVLLGRAGKNAQAVAMLDGVTNARYGQSALILQQQLLLNADAAQDTETARRAALKLVSLRLSPEDRTALVEDLRKLGINDKADQLARAVAASSPGSTFTRPAASIFDYETNSRLQSLVAAKNNDGALNLIKSVLAAVPPPATAGNAQWTIRSAVAELKRLHQLDAFVADARKQLAKDPDSLSLNYQLAVLLEDDASGSSLETQAAVSKHPPLWVKLTRSGDQIAGAYSADGQSWQEIGHAEIPLGAAPLAALAAATSQKGPKTTDVVIDHITLTPAPADTAADATSATSTTGATLPPPWQETLLPISTQRPDPVPRSVWQNGVLTLHAEGWDLWGRYDDVRLVHRALGAAAELAARVTAEDGLVGETKAGVMLRADLTANSPYAAVILLPGGRLTFQYRDRTETATPYWRKVVALQPKETRYGQALARDLAGSGRHDEAIALYDQLIASDPDEALGSANDLREVYHRGRILELTDRLLAWKPGPGNPGVGRSFFSYSFQPVAEAAQESQQPEKVIALCRRAMELDRSLNADFANTEVLDLLLKTLVQQGRSDEARAAVLAFFLPPDTASTAAASSGANSGPQLGFRSSVLTRTMNNWMGNVSWGGPGGMNLSNAAPLEVANRAGLLESLEAALIQRRAHSATEFAASNFDWLLALVQIDRREPAVLDDLPALLAKSTSAGVNMYGNNDQAQAAVRLEVARRLRSWPGCEAHAIAAFQAAATIAAGFKRQSNSLDVGAADSLQEAQLELALGDTDAAAATLGALATSLNFTGRSSGQNAWADLRRCLGLMLHAGPAGDPLYLDLYGKAMQSAQGKRELYFGYGMEKDMRTGENPHYQALAWLLNDGADSPNATLVYELRGTHPYDKDGRGKYAGSRGRSFAGSEGPRTLTFSYGPDADHFTPIGQVQTTSTFGTWTGPVPPGSGVLKVTIDTLRPADAAALSTEAAAHAAPVAPAATSSASPVPSPLPAGASAPAPTPKPAADYYLPIVRAANLITNPTFDGLLNRDARAETFSIPGWTDLPSGFWKPGLLDSPRPGVPYMQCELGDQSEHTITGARIAVTPGHAYFQSAWLRDPGDFDSCTFGRRYLDAGGNVLKTSDCPGFGSLMWRWQSQRLQTGPTDKAIDAIPPQTAFIEPFLRFRGAFDWTGLFLGVSD